MTDADFELARLFRDDGTPERDEAFADDVMAGVTRLHRAEMAGRLALSVAGIVCVLGLAIAAPAVLAAFGSIFDAISPTVAGLAIAIVAVVVVFGQQVFARLERAT